MLVIIGFPTMLTSPLLHFYFSVISNDNSLAAGSYLCDAQQQDIKPWMRLLKKRSVEDEKAD